jgi:hypothetical protein
MLSFTFHDCIFSFYSRPEESGGCAGEDEEEVERREKEKNFVYEKDALGAPLLASHGFLSDVWCAMRWRKAERLAEDALSVSASHAHGL